MKMKINLKGKTFLLFAAILHTTLYTQAQRTASVTVDAGTTYQHIDGFGGVGMSGQWAASYTQDKVDKLWGADGMGYNIMRIRIAPNENDWAAYVPTVKWGKAHGITVFASPWTPPHRFKVDAEQTWGQSSNHGHINTDSIEAYAKWLEQYRQYMESQDAAIDIISIQNECDYDPEGYEGCLYTIEEMTRMISAARKYIDPKCKVMAPECFGWGSHTYNKELVKSASVRNNTDIWGNHIYGANDLTYVGYVQNLTKKPMWMTEYIFDPDQVGNWDCGLNFAESIDNCLRHGFNAYIYYNMLDHFFGDGTGGGDKSSPAKFAYVMGHYARYATGLTRIKAVFTDNASTPVKGTAYASENGDTVNVFVLNPSESAVKLKVNLPFASRQVNAIVTNISRNRFVQDVSTSYSNTQTPEVLITAKSLYTLQFIRTPKEEQRPEDIVPMAAFKTETQANPINPYLFCADPTAIEHEGRLYVYGTNDQQQFNATNGFESNTYGYIKSLVMMSTEDLVNWTYHGTIDMNAVCGSWLSASWAPSIVSRVEDDGQTHFYMYFSNSGGGIGVITSTSPTGPWTAPLKDNLISYNTPGLGLCNNPFDPGVVIDNEGTGWLAFGGGPANDTGTDLQPGNARIVRLGKDMISLDSDIVPIPAPYHFEANELNIMSGKFVYSYCTSWRDRSEWSSYGSSLAAPSVCSICYMTSNNPLDRNSWTYKGEYLANPASFGYPGGNNHSHLQKFGSFFYLFYHTQWLEKQQEIDGGYRNIAMNKCTVREASQRITAVSASNTGITQLTAKRINPFQCQQAETLCTAAGISASNTATEGNTCVIPSSAGSWLMIKGVQFGTNGAGKFSATLSGTGKMEIYIDNMDSAPIATLEYASDEMETFTTECSIPAEGLHNVYILFRQVNAPTRFDSWQFTEIGGSGISDTTTPATVIRTEYYTIDGIHLNARPRKGLCIRKTWYDNGATQTEKVTVE